MYNLIIADLFKLRKSMAIKILFAITTLSAVAMIVMAYLIPQGKIDDSMSGLAFMFCDMSMMSILGAVIAGIYICGDIDNKTIHDAIANGCSRGAVIVSKTVVFFLAIAFILLPYAITTAIALGTSNKFSIGSSTLGFLHMLTSKGAAAFSISDIWKLLIIMIVMIIVYMAQLSVCVPLALALKKPALVIPIYYGFSILCGQLMTLKGKFTLFDNIFACTPYGGNHAFLTLDTASGDIFKTLFVSLIFIIAMLAVTYCAFRKSEIK